MNAYELEMTDKKARKRQKDRRFLSRVAVLIVLIIGATAIETAYGHIRGRYSHSKNIGPFDSITLSDDGWIGNSPTGPRTIYDSSTPDIAWAIGASEGMVFNGTGLGIGGSPTDVLHIEKEGELGLVIRNTDTVGGTNRVFLYLDSDDLAQIQFRDENGTPSGEIFYNIKLKTLSLRPGGISSAETIMFLDDTGVAIGSLSHDDRLDITGGGIIVQEQADDFAIVADTQLGHLRFHGNDDTGATDLDALVWETISTSTWTPGAQSSRSEIGVLNNGTINDDQAVWETDGSMTFSGNIRQSTDVGYPDKWVIKTFGIAGSGLDDNFAADADSVEQVLTFTTLIPAGATITEARLECDESTAGSGSTVITIEVGTTSSGAELLTGADTTTDNEINSTAAGAGIVVAANASATTVYVAADPAADWDTLTAGEWDIIIYYRDGGAARTQKGL